MRTHCAIHNWQFFSHIENQETFSIGVKVWILYLKQTQFIARQKFEATISTYNVNKKWLGKVEDAGRVERKQNESK